jgi:peptidoglycan/xylan/chitin deacetylase (PgdA/CDA1 family)
MRRACGVLLFMFALLALPFASQARAAQTVVSLTFDDGIKTQYDVARPILNSHGMKGTFYVNSGNLGANSYYMTWANTDQLNADGHEIAGHTVNHSRLTDLTAAQQQHQVCDDRTALQARGYTVTDFAYPYGAGGGSASIRDLIKNCGYASARWVGGIRDATDCPSCPYAEKLPPTNAYTINAQPYVYGSISLSQLQGWVTQAEQHGGGWVVLMFHDICNGCYDSSVSQTVLSQFLDWLQPRAATGTTVKTVRQALGTTIDTTPPTTTISCNNAACTSTALNAPVSVRLSATDNAGGSGVAATRYTTDGTDPTTTSTAYTSAFSVNSTTTIKFRSWDKAGNAEAVKTQTVNVKGSTDTTPPTTSIACNGAACPATSLDPPVSITLSAIDAGSGVASTRYTTDGTDPTTTSTAYTGPFSITATTTIKYRSWDVAGNAEPVRTQTVNVTPPPTRSAVITSPTAGATVSGTVTVVVQTSGNWAIPPNVDLFVDNDWNWYRNNGTNPYTIPWNATASGVGTHKLQVAVIEESTGQTIETPAINVNVSG